MLNKAVLDNWCPPPIASTFKLHSYPNCVHLHTFKNRSNSNIVNRKFFTSKFDPPVPNFPYFQISSHSQIQILSNFLSQFQIRSTPKFRPPSTSNFATSSKFVLPPNSSHFQIVSEFRLPPNFFHHLQL